MNQSNDTFSGKSILLVDDDERNIFALSSYLESLALKTVIANNGIECMKKLEKNRDIHLIFMDIMMPYLDGYETMREIKKKKEHSHIPVIALTARAMPGDKEKCLDAGAIDYISKPVDLDLLKEKMKHWLK